MPAARFGGVPGEIGAEDIFGPYDVVEGWPQDLAELPGHEHWTYGGARGVELWNQSIKAGYTMANVDFVILYALGLGVEKDCGQGQRYIDDARNARILVP